jgi:hypothetical protein
MPTSFWKAAIGSLRYEFRMQARRRALWVTSLLFSLLLFTSNPLARDAGESISELIAGWAVIVQTVITIAFGVMLADRTPRDRRLRTGELFDTYSAPEGARWIGKYAGSALATMLPLAIVFFGGAICVAIHWSDPSALLWAIACFLTINLPGLLFVAAFSIACPVVIWAPLYQVLFVGYWFWGNMLNPDFGIPTFSSTILTPVGDYPSVAFFHIDGLFFSEASVLSGIASIALLLAMAVTALWIGFVLLQRRAANQL